jgi:hypothetical protein
MARVGLARSIIGMAAAAAMTDIRPSTPGRRQAKRRGLCTRELAGLILQPTTGRIEGVADGDAGILGPAGHGWVACDVDVPAVGQGHVDADAIGVAVVMAMLRARDDHTGRCDATVEALKFLRLHAHRCFQGIGTAGVLESDLEGHLHDLGPCRGLGRAA